MPTTSKKLYEQVAQAIFDASSISCDDEHEALMTVKESLCSIFKADNPRFDADKFREACLTGKHIRKSIKERT